MMMISASPRDFAPRFPDFGSRPKLQQATWDVRRPAACWRARVSGRAPSTRILAGTLGSSAWRWRQDKGIFRIVRRRFERFHRLAAACASLSGDIRNFFLQRRSGVPCAALTRAAQG